MLQRRATKRTSIYRVYEIEIGTRGHAHKMNIYNGFLTNLEAFVNDGVTGCVMLTQERDYKHSYHVKTWE